MSRGEEAILGKFGGILRGFNIFVALTPSPFPTAWERGAARGPVWSAEAQLQQGGSFASALHSPPRPPCGRGGVGAHGGAPSPRPFGVLKRQLQRGGSFASALHSPPRRVRERGARGVRATRCDRACPRAQSAGVPPPAVEPYPNIWGGNAWTLASYTYICTQSLAY